MASDKLKEQVLGGPSAVPDDDGLCRRSPVIHFVIVVLVVIESMYAFYRISELPIIVCCTIVAAAFAVALVCSLFVSGTRAVPVFLAGYLVVLPCLGGAASALDIGATTLDCPSGTVPVGHVFPMGYSTWCREKSSTGEDIRSGPFRQWYSYGGPKVAGSYLGGKPHGMWTVWHASGAVYRKGPYDQGLKTGTWTWWKETGEKLSEVVYVKGKPVR
jgi:hypothetical protein